MWCISQLFHVNYLYFFQTPLPTASPEPQTHPVTTGAIFHKLSPKLQYSRYPFAPTALQSAETTEADWRCRDDGDGEKGGGRGRQRKRGRRRITATHGERVSEKGRRHNNRRGKLRRHRETWKTLIIGEHRGRLPSRETVAGSWVVVYLVVLEYYSHVFTG